MARSENQRIKILRVYEYLQMYSDENNPRSVQEIVEALEGEGIKCERRSIYDDIEILKKYGYDIQKKGYKHYLANRELNLWQIRFLMDVAQSAFFLPVKQTEEICAALEAIAGSHQADIVSNQIICFDKIKNNNDEVLDTVTKINLAIDNDCKISFKYFHLGFGGKREYRKNGDRYVQNPVGLVFHDGRYYFITYNEKYDAITTYRIDRMSDVRLEIKLPIVHSDKGAQFFVEDLKYRMSAFGMWDDEDVEVTFLVDNTYVEDIYEKFGDKINVSPYDKDHFTFKERVNLSDTFYGWCAAYGTHIKILSPQSVKDTLAKKLCESLTLYPEEKEKWRKQNLAKK